MTIISQTTPTPKGKIQEALKQVCPKQRFVIKRIEKGECNEVYIASSKDSKYVIRIDHDNTGRFLCESLIFDLCRAHGIPTPKVLFITDIPFKVCTRTLCIEDYLSGTPLDELPLSKVGKKNILYDAGTMLSRIHSVPINGWGLINHHGQARYKQVQDYVYHEVFEEYDLSSLRKKIGITQKELDSAYKALEIWFSQYKRNDTFLLHNDFHPRHVMVDNEKITGIIDMEWAEGGDPLKDIARWEYFEPDELTESLIQGYRATPFSEEERATITHWKIVIALWHLGYFLEQENPGGLQHTKKQLKLAMNSIT